MGAVEGPKITKEMLREVAKLARMELSEARVEALLPVLAELMQGVYAMSAVNVEGVEPATIFQLRKEP